MRKVVTYANDESKATEHSVGKGQAYGLSRGIALNLVRYCCNARDVHFLRALPAIAALRAILPQRPRPPSTRCSAGWWYRDAKTEVR